MKYINKEEEKNTSSRATRKINWYWWTKATQNGQPQQQMPKKKNFECKNTNVKNVYEHRTEETRYMDAGKKTQMQSIE